MRIVFIAPPPGNMSGELPGQAITQLSDLYPEHEWTMLQGMPLPGRLAFFKRQQNLRELRQLKPDVLLYASPDNLLPVDNVPVVVMVTEPLAKPPDHIKKALPSIKTILTDTEWLKSELMCSFTLPPEKVKVLRWMDEDIAADWHNKNLTREKYTAGTEYFYYEGPITKDGGWERVLHAFSQFKKWQQSGLQMVLAGPLIADYRDEFLEKFEAYKYRNEVAWLSDAAADEKKHLAAAAFGMLVKGQSFQSRQQVLRSFRAGIPVITEKHPVMEELAGDAVLYGDWKDTATISQHMITLYKNEDLSNRLVEKAKQMISSLSWQRTIDELYNALMAACEH